MEIKTTKTYKIEKALYDEAMVLLKEHRNIRLGTFIYESIKNEVDSIKKELEESTNGKK